MKRPELEFPLHWEYKIIAVRTEVAFAAICEVIRSHGFEERPAASNVSRNGSYVTYTVRMRLETREVLDSLSQALAACEGVKYLL
ncbi:HP0495 family protein [Desulfomicrobium salsuginis]